MKRELASVRFCMMTLCALLGTQQPCASQRMMSAPLSSNFTATNPHSAGPGGDNRVLILPRLQGGQTLRYESHARLRRHVKTESRVVTMLDPRELQRDLSTNLRLTIQDTNLVGGRPVVRALTELEPGGAASAANSVPAKHEVRFTIKENGQLNLVEGLEDLDTEQRLTWQFWITRFAYGWTLPSDGVKPGDKWKSEEPETTPTPVAKLVWERETTYVQNDKCPLLPAETCAIFLTHSTLKQKSSPKDTTPEDYRLQGLKTSGTAKGTNETVTYISLKTGLVLRATEEVKQTMDVTIAKADGSNQVHYFLDVSSQFETVFVLPDSWPQSLPPKI